MKKIISFALMAALILSLGGMAFAANTALRWDIDKKGVLTVYCKGEMPDYSKDAPPWEKQRKKIKSIVVEEGVTVISENTFQYCENAKTVILPESLTDIGDYAFYKCSALEKVQMPEKLDSIGKNCFDECRSLKEIVIPDGVEVIPDAAFAKNYALKSVSVPASLEEVGHSAFISCKVLKDVYYGGSQSEWSEIEVGPKNDRFIGASIHCGKENNSSSSGTGIAALEWSIDKKGLLSISGDGEMPDYSTVAPPWEKQRKEIKSVVIDFGITSISENAFQYCPNLVSISIPESVSAIGKYAFYKCSKLEYVELPSKLEVISEDTFNCCTSLEIVSFTSEVYEIESGAFNGCSSLKKVMYYGTPESWEDIEIGSYNRPIFDASIVCYQ